MRQFGKCGFRVSRILVCHKEAEHPKEKGDDRGRNKSKSVRDANETREGRRERRRGEETAADEPAADKYSSLTDDVRTSPPPPHETTSIPILFLALTLRGLRVYDDDDDDDDTVIARDSRNSK